MVLTAKSTLILVGVTCVIIAVAGPSLFVAWKTASDGQNVFVSRENGLEFLDKNALDPEVWVSPRGAQYRVLSAGEGLELDPDIKTIFTLRRLGLDGKDLFDGTGGTFIMEPSEVKEESIREAFSLVGIGGAVQIAIPWNLRTSDSEVEPLGPIKLHETTLWELAIFGIASKEEEEEVRAAINYPMASMLVVDLCGREFPDIKAAEGCWPMILGATQFIDPYCRPLVQSSLVEVALSGRASNSHDGLPQPRAKWEWVGPCLGILVSPNIVSAPEDKLGEYIYGSGTGGQDWTDSYEAISYLDEDKNGWLEGNELERVALWADENADGKPEDDEVTEAAEVISRINVRPKRLGSLDNWCEGDGVYFKDRTRGSSWCKISRGVD